jgi:hypothetical protein
MSHTVHRTEAAASDAPVTKGAYKAEDLPSNAPGLSWRERRKLRRFEKATGLDKSLHEVFEAIKHAPKAPVNRRHAA